MIADAASPFSCSFLKHCYQRTYTWQSTKTILLFILIFSMPPVKCRNNNNKTLSRSNSIDKRTMSNEYSYDDQTIEGYTSPPQTSGCGACKMRQEIKSRSLEAIKLNVLRKLQMEAPPNITGRTLPQVPPSILAMVDAGYGGMQSDQPKYRTGPSVHEEEDDFHIKTRKVFSFAQPFPKLRHSWNNHDLHDILYFAFSEGTTKHYVSNATLHVYVKGVEKSPTPSFNIEVFKVNKDPMHPNVPRFLKMASKRIIQPFGYGDFVRIDVTAMVSEWFKTRENLGFVVNGTVNGKRVVVTDGVGQIPRVEISTMEPKRRTRRNIALDCDEKSNERVCCRYPLTVDFEEFGWDFIIAPKKYEAHYCSGECPYVTLQRHPHTHLRQLASPNSAGPCCAPRKLSAISMLYFDQQFNVIYGSLPGMVVDRCGCS